MPDTPYPLRARVAARAPLQLAVHDQQLLATHRAGPSSPCTSDTASCSGARHTTTGTARHYQLPCLSLSILKLLNTSILCGCPRPSWRTPDQTTGFGTRRCQWPSCRARCRPCRA
eukprot:937286-Pyramimonas_sp.AAC.1